MLEDRDAQLTLWCLYELQYRGLAVVDERWEWSPAVLTLPAALESAFEAELRDAVGDLPRTFADVSRDSGLVAAFDAVDRALPGPGASRYVQRSVSLPQWQELLVSKSIYQLKEADPHSWAILASPVTPRRRWSRSSTTSTARVVAAGSTASCSQRPCACVAWTPATGPTWTPYPSPCSPSTT